MEILNADDEISVKRKLANADEISIKRKATWST